MDAASMLAEIAMLKAELAGEKRRRIELEEEVEEYKEAWEKSSQQLATVTFELQEIKMKKQEEEKQEKQEKVTKPKRFNEKEAPLYISVLSKNTEERITEHDQEIRNTVMKEEDVKRMELVRLNKDLEEELEEMREGWERASAKVLSLEMEMEEKNAEYEKKNVIYEIENIGSKPLNINEEFEKIRMHIRSAFYN